MLSVIGISKEVYEKTQMSYMQSPEVQEVIYKLKFNAQGGLKQEVSKEKLIEAYKATERRRMELMQSLFQNPMDMNNQMQM